MGFDEGNIVFNSVNDTFYPGQILSGRLEFDLSKTKSYRGLYLEIKGFCKVHWTTSHTRRVNDRTEHYDVTHESYEEYMNVTIYLAGDKTGDHTLNVGHHSFPFQCQIPPHCPSTFSGSNGHVKYQVKAVVDRSFKLNQTKTADFKIIAPLDLNSNPYCKEPIEMEFHQSYCCWCMNAGNSETLVKVPAGGWCPKQVVPVEVACTNTSSVELDIKLQIKREVIYRAEREPDTRYDHDTIVEVKKGPIGGGTTRNYTVDIQLPDMDVLNMMNCRFIDVNYKFKVQIETSGCHEDDEESRPFIIGSIPVGGAPGELAQVSPGVGYFPAGPVITQPLPGAQPPYYSPGAGNPPYPNQPFPGPNPPYPNTPNMVNNSYPASPNPPHVSPYPPNPPYPTSQGQNPPYPASPGQNPPYPANPVQNSPYPPNPGQNPPYPTIPGQNPPYPTAGGSPYPPSSTAPSNPGITSSPLLKTGTIGFVGDGSTVPLLPAGAGVPYPPSPFASASAPTPSSPDESKTPEEMPMIHENPPFNPQYK